MEKGKKEREILLKMSKIEAIMLCLCLTISSLFLGFMVLPVYAQAEIYIDPTPVTASVCSNFIVAVNIRSVTDLWVWQFRINFNPALLECISVTEGPFLMQSGPTIWPNPVIDNNVGTILAGCSRIGPPPGSSGSGTLAYIEFHCDGPGECDLTFVSQDTYILNSYLNSMPRLTFNGHVIQNPAVMYIDPPSVNAFVCSNFSVAVNIRDVTDLYGWQFGLTFNPALLECLSVTEGPFLRQSGATIFATQIDNNVGMILAFCVRMIPPGVSGSGTLAYIEFHCDGPGQCDLIFDLQNTLIVDSDGDTMPLITANGHVNQVEIYWKPNYIDYAPSGLADFDQRQDQWGYIGPGGFVWTHCGPTAVANSFWWLDSEYETGGIPPPTISDNFPLVESYIYGYDDHHPNNVPPFILDLAARMNTGPQGTEVHDLERGIESYLASKGLLNRFYEITEKMPTINFVWREFMRCQDVVLLLGFWQWDSPTGRWIRTGGHYVTVAGMGIDQDQNYWIAFSDPIRDNAEPPPRGTNVPGQVIPPPPHPHPPAPPDTLHNDALYVSHDGYMAAATSSPGGLWGVPWYEYDGQNVFVNCQGQNIPDEFLGQTGHYNPSLATSVEVEYAIVTSPWVEKPPYIDYAPNGPPDFDQRQDMWWNPITGQWSWCGPTAVANSLWWLDSEYEPGKVPPPTYSDGFPLVKTFDTAPPLWDDHDEKNVDPLVRRLAFLMDTDGNRTGLVHSGTNVLDMQAGIAQYLSWTGINPPGDCDGNGVVDNTDKSIVAAAFGSKPGDINWDMRADLVVNNKVDTFDLITVTGNLGKGGKFYEKTMKKPDFYYIEEQVEKCEDVTLLLGFWQEAAPGYWIRVGGHYVTVTGVDSMDKLLSFSDPYYDNAESGGYGRVIPPPPHGHTSPPETIHNNAKFVSHDYYFIGPTPSPGGFWGPEKYPVSKLDLWNFLEQNCPIEFQNQQGFVPGLPVSVEIEYAVIVSCRGGLVVAGSEDTYVYAFDFDGNLLWQNPTVAPVLSVAVDNEGNYVAAGSRLLGTPTGALYFYDRIGTQLWSRDLLISDSYDGGWMGTESKSVDVKYNSYNQFDVVAAAHDLGLNLYDQWGNLIWTYHNHGFPETIVRISQDGNYIVAADYYSGVVNYFSHLTDGTAGWGPGDGTPVWSTSVPVYGRAFWVAISGLGEWIAVSGWDPSGTNSLVQLLDSSGALVWRDWPTAKGYFIRVDMPCDGKSVVAVNDDFFNTVGCQLNYYGVAGGIDPIRWDFGDGVPDWIYDPALSPFDDFYSVAISGNGDVISTGPSIANSIYVLNSGGALLQIIGDGVMQSVDLTYEGKYGVDGDNNGVVWFFSKDSGLLWTYQTGGCIHSVAIPKIYPCMYPYPNHDVAVTNVQPRKTVVCQTYSVRINVTVNNHGDFTETFDVMVYGNNTQIGIQTVTLNPGDTVTLIFMWNTAGFVKGRYLIIAKASIVHDELDVYDDTYINGWVIVTYIGDLTCDGIVDVDDVVPIALAYASSRGPDGNYWHSPPCPTCPHSPNCDISCDGIIDIDDIIPVAIHFGEVDP